MTKISKVGKNIILTILIAILMAFLIPSGLTAQTDEPKTSTEENKKPEATSSINSAAFTLVLKDFFPKIPPPAPIPEKSQLNLETTRYYQRRLKRERIENTCYDISLVTFGILNIADYFSTRKALRQTELSEGNPIMKPFVKNDLAFAAVKFGLLTSNYFLMKKLHRKNKILAWILTMTNNFVLSYIVVNNLKLIREIQSK